MCGAGGLDSRPNYACPDVCHAANAYAALATRWQRLLRASLADLLRAFLALIANTLLLVRIRLAQSAHFGRYLSDLLAVDAGNGEGRLLRIDRHRDSGRKRVFDRVRVAESEDDDVLRLDFSPVS